MEFNGTGAGLTHFRNNLAARDLITLVNGHGAIMGIRAKKGLIVFDN
jgi:hypothetical protein